MSQTGQVMRAHGHVFYVSVNDELIECRPRGRFRLHGDRVLAGDNVIVRQTKTGEGYIEKVLPRRTVLTRPPVANVDQVAIVYTAKEPDLDWRTLDRFLVLAEAAHLDVILVINKIDLVEQAAVVEALAPYDKLGYPLVQVSAHLGQGVELLLPLLQGKVTVLAGQSGVGKSRLLNAIEPDLQLQTGSVSRRGQRGRHTTRHVALLHLTNVPDALVVDTPGFSQVELDEIEREDLRFCFPELHQLEGHCRYRGCLHHQEPECAVQTAVEQGNVAPSRYENYVSFLEEIIARPPRYD